MKTRRPNHILFRASAAPGLSWLILAPLPGLAQLTPDQISQFKELARATPNLGGVNLDQRVSGLLGPVTVRVLTTE